MAASQRAPHQINLPAALFLLFESRSGWCKGSIVVIDLVALAAKKFIHEN